MAAEKLITLANLTEYHTKEKAVTDALNTNIGDLSTITVETSAGVKATNLVAAANELKLELDNATSAGNVKVEEATTPETGYLKTYNIIQGKNADDTDKVVGKINIPKDFVVKSGSVVKDPEGQEDGTYIALVINVESGTAEDSTVYINVKDLCDVYTAAESATEVQVAISDTNVVSATLVDGGVATAKLADSAVTNGKIADATIARAKIDATFEGNIAALETTVGDSTKGLVKAVADNTTEIGVEPDAEQSIVGSGLKKRVKDLEIAVGDGGSIDTRITNAINALDVEHTATTGEDYVVDVVETDGKISVTYGAYALNTEIDALFAE